MIPRFIRYARSRHRKKLLRIALMQTVINIRMTQMRVMQIMQTPIPKFRKGSPGNNTSPIEKLSKEKHKQEKAEAVFDVMVDSVKSITKSFEKLSEYSKLLNRKSEVQECDATTAS